ncbi:MAG: type II toxin-antitoxin system HicA family toxin [Bacteroidales bacterium]|nr:type II toxin-antitoxin system HicA family toxin [Bacteroidales bacterium]
MKKNELTRKLAASGCYICRNGANHEWWYSPLTESYFPISRHGVTKIPKGTLKSIEKQSGVKLV